MKCRICGKTTKVIDDHKFGNIYDWCVECDFIGLRSSHLISFEEERLEYDRHENSIENKGYVTMFKKFLEQSLFPYIDGGEGLDFGSGPEPVLTQVMERDYGLLMDHYDLHYQPNKVYENREYDFIVSTEVAEHLEQPLEVIKMLTSHLKVGGVLAIMTLFHEKDESKFLKWWYRRDITHIGFFTPKTFQVIGKELGLEVIYTDGKRYMTMRKLM